MWNPGKPETDKSVGEFQNRLRDKQLARIFDPNYQEPAPEGPKSYDQPLADFLDGKWGDRLQPLLATHVFGMENAERGASQWIRSMVSNTGLWPGQSQQCHFFQALTLLHEKKSKELTQLHFNALRNGAKILADLPEAMKTAGITPGKLPDVLNQPNLKRRGISFDLEKAASKAYEEDVLPSINANIKTMTMPYMGISYQI